MTQEPRDPVTSPIPLGLATAQPSAKNPASPGAVLAFAAGLIALAVVVGVLIHFNSSSYRAEKACKAYVLDQLKSPSSAKFSDVDFFDTDDPEVNGSVDAQNDFGASIRSRFSCSMTKDRGDWTVSDGYLI